MPRPGEDSGTEPEYTPLPEKNHTGFIVDPLPEENTDLIVTAGDGENANVEIGSYDDLPPNAKDAYDKYEQTGWKGNVPGQAKGTHAGGTWKNENAQLPYTDSNGNPITYREFDVNSAGPNGRDAGRFVVGSDGSVWYTDSHYGDNPSKNGIADFIKIK